MQPLEGITVVTLEHAIAAPFATRQLADLGARVIKIERPGVGDFARGYDERVRRPGLALRLDQPLQGKPDARRQAPGGAELLRAADPREGRRRRAEPRARRRRAARPVATSAVGEKPAIIVCDISGYGDDGPYRDKKAYDLLIQSESGFVSVTGTPDEPCKAGPRSPTSPPACTRTRASWPRCCSAQQTGRGQHIDISMLEVAGRVDELSRCTTRSTARRRRRAPAPATRRSIPTARFPPGDGKTVMLGLQNEREWAASATRCCCSRRSRATRVSPATRKRSAAARRAARDHRRRLRRAHAPSRWSSGSTPRRSPTRASTRCTTSGQHPQLQARGRWREVDTPAGPLPALLPPGSWDEGDPRMDAVPALGEHTDAILAELGLLAPARRSRHCAPRRRI